MLIDFDFKYVDLSSLIFSFIINFIIFMSLTSENFSDSKTPSDIRLAILIIGLIQVFINISALGIFLFSKYNLSFYYSLNGLIKEKFTFLVKKDFNKNIIIDSLSLYDKFRIYILDSIILDEDIYFVLINLILGILGIINFYTSFLFSLQLITISKFVPTLNDILKAFKSRYDQLIAMVFFLFILIYFYANVGMFFLKTEFDNMGTGHVRLLFFLFFTTKLLF